jgi:hypothetical protein
LASFEAQTFTYRLAQIDRDGTRTVAGETAGEVGAPEQFALHGAFPNPMRSGQTTIRHELPEERAVAGVPARGQINPQIGGGMQVVGSTAELTAGPGFFVRGSFPIAQQVSFAAGTAGTGYVLQGGDEASISSTENSAPS